MVRLLYAKGALAILYAPYGGEVQRRLNEWQGTMKAHARVAREKAWEEQDAIVEKEKKLPALLNPVWIWVENHKTPGSQEKELAEAARQDTVWCKVETEELMPGDSITFSLYLNARDGKPEEKIDTIMGRVGENRKDHAAVGKWLVDGVTGRPAPTPSKDRFYFVAKNHQHKLEVKSGLLKLAPAITPFQFSS